MTELQQNKNSFKVRGKVTRIDKDGAFKEEQATKGKKEGETYRSLRFGVKTSDNNEIFVSMFDFEPEQVFLWNSDMAKKAKEKKKEYKGKKIDFAEWLENQDELREEGYAVLQTRVGLTHDDKGKLVSKGLPSFVASEEIYNNLDNGESVVIEGSIRYSTYKNRDDKEVEQKTYTIEKLFKVKDIDFEAEDFEEITYFEQEMVFVDALADKKEGKIYVTGRIIDYWKNFHDTQMVINYKDNNGQDDKDMVKLAGAFAKTVKFGDVIKVYGETLNKVVVSEVKQEDIEDEDDALALLGGKPKPQHKQSYTSNTYITEFQIHGVESWDKKVYKEEDFVKNELLVEEDFGGKANKTKNNNPFLEVSDESESDDDLPF